MPSISLLYEEIIHVFSKPSIPAWNSTLSFMQHGFIKVGWALYASGTVQWKQDPAEIGPYPTSACCQVSLLLCLTRWNSLQTCRFRTAHCMLNYENNTHKQHQKTWSHHVVLFGSETLVMRWGKKTIHQLSQYFEGCSLGWTLDSCCGMTGLLWFMWI